MFGRPHTDAMTIQSLLAADAPIPLAGFFCAGEIAPIGGRNFLHTHTASIALFRVP
jgi:small ligand-binding sensory domain FIST